MIKKYIVEGMSCSACSASVERVVSKIDGVKSANVNLISKILLVEATKPIDDSVILSAVTKAGFTPSIYKPTINTKSIKYTESKINVKTRLIISFIFLLPLMWFSMYKDLNLPIFSFIDKDLYPIRYIVTLALLALPIIIINFKFYINGVKGIIHLSPNMDTLISLGSFISYVYSLSSIITVLNGKELGNLYFDSSAMILTFITIGKAIEAKSKSKSNEDIDLLKKLLPEEVTLLKDGKEIKTNIKDVKEGDLIISKAGDIIPLDSVIIEGSAFVDESTLTGESMLVSKTINDQVLNGSINKDGYLILKVLKEESESTISKIIESSITAGATKSNMQHIADKVSGVFVPTVIGIAIIVFILWFVTSKDIELSIKYGIEVLVVSCPCALGLATPVAVVSSISSSSKQGILIKEANTFENIHDSKIVIFDKTGTLTKNKMKVSNVIFYQKEDSKYLEIIKGLEEKSNHPVKTAILDYLRDFNAQDIENHTTIPGKGIKGDFNGITYYCGNKELLLENKLNDTKIHNVYLFTNEKIILSLDLEDELKEESFEVVDKIKKLGYQVYMLSGDNYDTCLKIKEKLNLDAFYSNVSPSDKSNIIKDVQQNGLKTIYVGDGINDTIALKEANVGISFLEGTDIAKHSSDCIFLKDNIKNIPKLIEISNKTVKIIKENLFWAFFYNIISIPLAAGALSFIGISLTPAIASIMMSLSSIIVTGNALRLRRK